MSAQESIILGVMAGIATTILISVSLVFFNKIVLPWYRGLIYNGIDISGEWVSELRTREIKETALMVIDQKASLIRATMTVSVHQPDDRIEQKMYRFNGALEDRVLSLAGRNINKKKIGVDVSLLEISSGGDKMVGVESWFSTMKNAIDSESVTWERKLI